MTMRVGILAVFAVVSIAQGAAAQGAASPGCSFDVKVLDARRVWVNCGRRWPEGTWAFTLWEYDTDWERDPATRIRSRGTPASEIDGRVAKLTFAADAVQGSKEYRLVIGNTADASADPVILPFSTSPDATLTLLANRTQAQIASVVAFAPKPTCGANCTIVETITPRLFLRDGTRLPAVEVPHSVSIAIQSVEDVAAIGTAALTLTGTKLGDGSARLRFAGLTNVFGETVEAIGEVDTIVPASADEADYAIKVGFQSAKGERAAYSLDAEARPLLAAWGLTYWRLLGTVDLGHNDRLSANAITVGTEVAFPFRQLDLGPIFGAKPIASVNYETDKDGDVGNLLGTVETRVRLRGLYRPRKVVQSVIAVGLTEQLRQAISASRVKAPDWGLVVPLQIGFDVGGNVRSKPPDGTAEPVPEAEHARIARFRVASGAVVEYKRLTITEGFAVRYLFADERLDRSDPATPPIEGFKSNNALSAQVSLDRLGHYALALTYKYGAAPPTYQTVNSLVSSIAILF